MSIPVAWHDQLAQWDLYESTVNNFFASYLTQIDFVVRHFEKQ